MLGTRDRRDLQDGQDPGTWWRSHCRQGEPQETAWRVRVAQRPSLRPRPLGLQRSSEQARCLFSLMGSLLDALK